MAHRIEWGGFTLGDFSNGDDYAIDGRAGIKLVSQRQTTMTPNAAGGETRGASVPTALEITTDWVRAKTRDGLLAFLGAMAPIGAVDETPLLFNGLLWGDADDEDLPVQVWAGPESKTPRIDAQALAAKDWRAEGVSWIASDPTVFSAEETVLDGGSAAPSQLLTFTNRGNAGTLSGRAWTGEVTAVTAVHSPFVDLGDQRVTWEGLNLAPGQVLVIDRHRHTRIGSLGVDGYRVSNSTPNPDWPVFEPGVSAMTVGAASGTLTAQVRARSTWVI